MEDKNKFIIIYEKYNVLVSKICIKITENDFLWEDAMQNTFVRIADNIEKIYLFPENEQRAYISTIAKNCAINVLNEEKRFMTESLNFHLDYSSSKNVQDEYVANEQYKTLISHIYELNNNYRDILILSFVNKLSVREIAFILNKPVRTVWTRLSRGKALMEKKLKELGIE